MVTGLESSLALSVLLLLSLPVPEATLHNTNDILRARFVAPDKTDTFFCTVLILVCQQFVYCPSCCIVDSLNLLLKGCLFMYVYWFTVFFSGLVFCHFYLCYIFRCFNHHFYVPSTILNSVLWITSPSVLISNLSEYEIHCWLMMGGLNVHEICF